MTLSLLLACSAWTAAAPLVLTLASARGERRIPVRAERGFPVVAAAQLAPILSIQAETPRSGAAPVRVLGRPMEFVLDATYYRYEGRVYGLAAPPYLARDSLFVPLQWLVEHLPTLFGGRFHYDAERGRLEQRSSDGLPLPLAPAPAASRPANPRGPGRARVVALDPGHGGADPGMVGPLRERPFLREKDVTLAVARFVAEELERRGVTVVMTRTGDTLVRLTDRGRRASARGAQVFVSIHVNAANPRWRDPESARGFETYFLAEARTEDARRVEHMENEVVRFETTAEAPEGDPLRFILNDLAQNEHLRESSRMAAIVQGELGRVHPAESRGVKQAGFIVLTTTYMPAVLVEIGFGSNRLEARYLTGASGQRRIARGIAEGIVRYLDEYERRLAAANGGER